MELWILLFSLCGSVDNDCLIAQTQPNQVVIQMCVSRQLQELDLPERITLEKDDNSQIVTYILRSTQCYEV